MHDIDEAELWRFFGLILFLGLYHVPERRLLWIRSSKFYNSFVSGVMTRHRFEDILLNLHWHNTAQYTDTEVKAKNKQDSFWRLKELMDLLVDGNYTFHEERARKG